MMMIFLLQIYENSAAYNGENSIITTNAKVVLEKVVERSVVPVVVFTKVFVGF